MFSKCFDTIVRTILLKIIEPTITTFVYCCTIKSKEICSSISYFLEEKRNSLGVRRKSGVIPISLACRNFGHEKGKREGLGSSIEHSNPEFMLSLFCQRVE